MIPELNICYTYRNQVFWCKNKIKSFDVFHPGSKYENIVLMCYVSKEYYPKLDGGTQL